MCLTRESGIHILAGLHWAMARKATKLAELAREYLSQGEAVMPTVLMDSYEEDMQDCCRIAKVLAHS